MSDQHELPPSVFDAIHNWLEHHDRCVPGLLVGLYLVGSLALEDWRPGSDIDIVAVLEHEPTDDEVELLRAAHEASIAEGHGIDIDGRGWPLGSSTTRHVRHSARGPSVVSSPTMRTASSSTRSHGARSLGTASHCEAHQLQS